MFCQGKAGEVGRWELTKQEEGSKSGGGVGGRRSTCSYEKGGRGLLHGVVGTRKWRPAWKTEADEEGKMFRKRNGRDKFWVCVVGDKGLRRQIKLSFVKKTPGDTQEGSPDTTTTQGEGGAV